MMTNTVIIIGKIISIEEHNLGEDNMIVDIVINTNNMNIKVQAKQKLAQAIYDNCDDGSFIGIQGHIETTEIDGTDIAIIVDKVTINMLNK